MVCKPLVLALTAILAMTGVVLADEAAFTPITSLRDVLIPKNRLPQGWTLLEKRVIRDNHDLNLLSTIDIAAKMFRTEISEKACQPMKIAGESFNVDFFFVKDGRAAEGVWGFVNGWTKPGTQGDIRWGCERWQNIIIVICTSDEKIQRKVFERYYGNLLEVLDVKATEQLKRGQKDKALECYKFLASGLKDLPHAYQIWGGLFQYKAQDYPKAIVCYERAAKEGGETAFTLQEQWQIQEGLGLCAGLSKDLKKAEAAFLKSLEIARKSQDKRLLGSSNYNLACAYAEQELPDQMYPYLEEALKLDRKYAADAPKDSSFAKYAGQARFKALIGKYSKGQ